MSEDLLNASKDADLGYGQLFSVLARRSPWIIGSIIIAILLAAYNSLQKEPTYRSSMQLLVEPNYRERGDRFDPNRNVFAEESPLEIDYATQIRVMQGSELLERALQSLQVEYPDMTIQDIKEYLAVFRVTETEDEIDTNILQVDYTSNDPDKARRVLSTLRVVYLDYNLEQQQLRLQNGLSFINEQLPVAREDVLRAEQSLEQFRESQSLIDPEQKATELAQSLSQIEQERRKIRADFQDYQAQYEVLRRQLARSPERAFVSSRLSESTRYQTLLDEYQTIEMALAEQRVQFTDDAPYVARLRQQLDNQQALLRQEVGRILGATSLSGENLLSEGQLGETDILLLRELGDVQTILAGLSARDQGLSQAEQQIRAEIGQFPGLIAEFTRLQPEIQIKRETLQQLLQARQELSIEIARGGFNWQVVEEPQLGNKTGPSLVTDVLLGGIAGLFLGIVLAFLREAMDKAIHTPGQIREKTTVPVLGSVPRFPRGRMGTALPFGTSSRVEFPIMQTLSWPPFRESLDLLYKNIQLIAPTSPSVSLAVTSAIAAEGKSTIALGLAMTAARLHKNVLLIDSDLRHPSLHEHLNLSYERGLTNVLTGQDAEPFVQQISLFDCTLNVLTAGMPSQDPVRLLQSQTMKHLLANLADTYDLIVMDSSPVLGTVDALQIASICDQTLLVARLNQITQSDLMEAVALLQHTDLIGIVANDDPRFKTTNITRLEQNTYASQQAPKTESAVPTPYESN